MAKVIHARLARADATHGSSLALIALSFFIVLATLLPFVAVPLPGAGAVALAPLALLAFHVVWLARPGQSVRSARWLEIAVAGFVALIVVAFCLGVASYGASREATFAAFNLAMSALVPLGVMRAVISRAQLRAVVRVLLLAAGAAGVVSLALYALPNQVAERLLLMLAPIGYPDGPQVIRTVWGTGLERATGTWVDPNMFGGLMMVATSLVAGQLLAREAVLRRPLLLALGGVAIAGLVLSLSRSAWVGTAVAFVYLGLFLERRAFIVVAIAAIVVLAAPPLRDRIGGALLVRDEASVMRVDEYRASTALVAAHPLFGVGFGPAFEIDLVRRVSNMYLLIAEEMGLAGLAGLLGVLGLVLARSLHRLSSLDPDAGLWGGLQAAVVGCLAVGLFDHYLLNSLFPHTAGLFWLLVGLLSVAARLGAARAERAAPVDFSESAPAGETVMIPAATLEERRAART